MLNLLPAQLEKDLEANSEREDRRLRYISLGIKWTMAVSDKKRYRRRGHPGLHLLVMLDIFYKLILKTPENRENCIALGFQF